MSGITNYIIPTTNNKITFIRRIDTIYIFTLNKYSIFVHFVVGTINYKLEIR